MASTLHRDTQSYFSKFIYCNLVHFLFFYERAYGAAPRTKKTYPTSPRGGIAMMSYVNHFLLTCGGFHHSVSAELRLLFWWAKRVTLPLEPKYQFYRLAHLFNDLLAQIPTPLCCNTFLRDGSHSETALLPLSESCHKYLRTL